MDDFKKVLLDKVKSDGFATALCGNGDRVFLIAKEKLVELLKQVEDKGQDIAMILIQNPNRIN